MDNIKRLKLNTITSLGYQVILVVTGLIVPRFILSYYGSEINGLVSSITQFLNLITFFELGVGGVVQSALYKPLYNRDDKSVSSILNVARQFFNNLAKILTLYVIAMIIFYPLVTNSNLNYVNTGFLIFSMSLGLFAQYLFGMVNQLLLNADQKLYVSQIVLILVTILNTIATIILIISGASVVTVKFLSGLILLIRPIFLSYYIKRNYNLNLHLTTERDVLPQKWNGVAQHLAYTISNSTDIVLLTLFTTLENVSIYSVYYMIVNGLKMLITAFSNSIQPFLGNLIAEGDTIKLKQQFSKMEWILHTSVTYIFGVASILILDFVSIYTMNVDDANYYTPAFSILITLSQMLYCIRLPYNTLINAAGHFKQTQASALIEASINIILSSILIWNFGLVGVALGTLVAMFYRTIYLVHYLKNRIINQDIRHFYRHLFVDTITFMSITIMSSVIDLNITNYFEWLMAALLYGGISLIIVLIWNVTFYKSQLYSILNYGRKKN